MSDEVKQDEEELEQETEISEETIRAYEAIARTAMEGFVRGLNQGIQEHLTNAGTNVYIASLLYGLCGELMAVLLMNIEEEEGQPAGELIRAWTNSFAMRALSDLLVGQTDRTYTSELEATGELGEGNEVPFQIVDDENGDD